MFAHSGSLSKPAQFTRMSAGQRGILGTIFRLCGSIGRMCINKGYENQSPGFNELAVENNRVDKPTIYATVPATR